jgi:hypothetical protein
MPGRGQWSWWVLHTKQYISTSSSPKAEGAKNKIIAEVVGVSRLLVSINPAAPPRWPRSAGSRNPEPSAASPRWPRSAAPRPLSATTLPALANFRPLRPSMCYRRACAQGARPASLIAHNRDTERKSYNLEESWTRNQKSGGCSLERAKPGSL